MTQQHQYGQPCRITSSRPPRPSSSFTWPRVQRPGTRTPEPPLGEGHRPRHDSRSEVADAGADRAQDTTMKRRAHKPLPGLDQPGAEQQAQHAEAKGAERDPARHEAGHEASRDGKQDQPQLLRTEPQEGEAALGRLEHRTVPAPVRVAWATSTAIASREGRAGRPATRMATASEISAACRPCRAARIRAGRPLSSGRTPAPAAGG